MTQHKRTTKLTQQTTKQERRQLEQKAQEVHSNVEKTVRGKVIQKTNAFKAQSAAAQRRVARQKAEKAAKAQKDQGDKK